MLLGRCPVQPGGILFEAIYLLDICYRIAMVFAMVVYVMAGKVIYDRRKHLDGYLNPLNDYPFANTVTRTQEIHVTHEDRPEYRRDSSEPITAADRSDSRAADEIDAYTFQVEAPQLANNQRLPAALRLRSLTRDAAQEAPNVEAWLYARVAFLFFAALLITWVRRASPSITSLFRRLLTSPASRSLRA